MSEIYNFSAGPAMLPNPVLRQMQEELLEYGNAKASVMEISHRGVDFMAVAQKAEQDLRELMNIPNNYKVLNEVPYLGAEVLPGYLAYKMNMKRKYRDVLAESHFIIALQNLKADVPVAPIKVHFENLKQRLHSDETYQISTLKLMTKLEGPELAEATYPQKLGM